MTHMQWINRPDKWTLENQSLSLFVTPGTDYWRETHYGFTVDDGPFLYELRGGEFEVRVKLTGSYKTRFDQMSLMLRVDEKRWIKAGIEFVNNKLNVSAVVTRGKSDWSMFPLPDSTESIWIKAIRISDFIELSYSLDDQEYSVYRLAPFPENIPVKVGMAAASPEGDGFNAEFKEFEIRHLPDSQRSKWLKNQTE